VVVALLTIFILIYSARVLVINELIKEQLSQYQMKINCMDISLASNMAIIVDKLCIQSSKADIEMVDMAVQWQYLPRVKISNVDIKRINIRGTEHLFSNVSLSSKENDLPNESNNNNQSISQLLSATFQPYLRRIKQFKLPIKLNINEVLYLPFTVKNKLKTFKNTSLGSQKKPYIASLSVVDSMLTFSIQNANEAVFIKAELNKSKSNKKNKNKNIPDFTVALSIELRALKKFVNAHQLPITAELENIIKTNEIAGRFDTFIEYQAGALSMQNQITDLTLTSDKGIGKSGAFKLMADLHFESQLQLMANKIVDNAKDEKSNKSDQKIALTFTGKNAVSLEYSQANFLALLEQNHVSPAIISLLEDNPLAQLTFKLKNKATLTLNNQQLYLSAIEMKAKAKGNKRYHHVKLDNITLGFANNSPRVSVADDSTEKRRSNANQTANQAANALTVESFIIDSELKLPNIVKFTTVPVVVHLEGSLQKTEKQTELNLSENSSLIAKTIVFAKQQSSSVAATVTTKNNVLLKLKTLTAKLEGNLQLRADNAVSVNLKVHSQALQLDFPKILQINSFDLFSEIKGNLDDIHINATASADGVNLGSIIIVGSALSPKVKVVASKLQLTDLLSLNIQLPTKIELIDGTLDYSVSGKLTDLLKLENNIIDASVALTSVSGDIDGIWIRDLNWQQNFTLFAGKIATIPSATENLTVALIETPIQISKFSININGTFNNRFKFSANKLKANILGGSFSIPKIKWPIEHGYSANIKLNSIDLEQLLALNKKQGIVVTGKVSGQIPVTFDGEKYIIEKGELYNISNGLIQVMDNPAVVALKANNTQLQLAFEALQNLYYHQLSSAVSMKDDGYMLLETVIKGHNPDIDNDVNLNLNLRYDLLGLLESMSITQRFEDSILKGLQK